LASGQAEAFRLSAPATGRAGTVHVYLDTGNAASTLSVGIYANAHRHPGSLLGAGSASANPPGTWSAVSIAPVQLEAGQTYWLAILGQGGMLRYRDRGHGPCPSQTSAQTSLTALPGSWKTGVVYSDCPASAYVTAAEPVVTLEPTLPPSSPLESTTPGGSTGPTSPTPPPTEPTPPPPPTESSPPPPPSPPPPAPTASFTYSPAAPVVGQVVTLDAVSSTCADAPCTYEWSDDGGPTRPETVLWPLGAGQTLQFAFSEAGTKHVRLVVADAAGQTATVEHDVVVAEVPPPPPPPPLAPTDASPPTVSGTAEVGQTLTAGNGTWSGTLPMSYTYRWQDCNASGVACVEISGATAFTYAPVASDVGHTLRVVVSASNAGGTAQASSLATAAVTSPPPPPPPAAPTNTAPPAISGSAVEGQTLSASAGAWTGEPTSYAYQWQDCDAAGASCANVGGATKATYTLAAGDVGHTLRVAVTAGNTAGSATASSAPTAAVTAHVSEPEEPSLTMKECFANPEVEGTRKIEACGYPGESNTGVEKSALEKGLKEETGAVRLTGEEHYENKRLAGTITIAWNARNVVIKNDEIIDKDSCPAPRYSLNYGCVGNAIEFERKGSGSGDEVDEAAKGTRISHVKVGGAERHGPNTVQTCVDARWNSPYVAEYVNTEYCSGFKLNAGGELNHVYCPSNYEIGGEHYECVTDEGNELNASTLHTRLVIKNSTIFQPPIKESVESSGLTAAIFQQSLYGSVQETILEKNLIAGGNFSVYFGEEAGQSYKLTGPDTVKYNRFARCTSGRCPDSHGYFEEFGAYHIAAFYSEAKMTWQNNFIDDNTATCVLGEGLCY
jgi:hypothetical protein